jgi:hypothetical protein
VQIRPRSLARRIRARTFPRRTCGRNGAHDEVLSEGEGVLAVVELPTAQSAELRKLDEAEHAKFVLKCREEDEAGSRVGPQEAADRERPLGNHECGRTG